MNSSKSATVSNLAQRKRAGLITLRSQDRNLELLSFFCFGDHYSAASPVITGFKEKVYAFGDLCWESWTFFRSNFQVRLEAALACLTPKTCSGYRSLISFCHKRATPEASSNIRLIHFACVTCYAKLPIASRAPRHTDSSGLSSRVKSELSIMRIFWGGISNTSPFLILQV